MSVISTGSEGVSYLLIVFCFELSLLIGGFSALPVFPVLPDPEFYELYPL